MKVLFVTPETHPLMSTGCLGEVSGALPSALEAAGADVRILMPAYPQALDRLRRRGRPIALGNPLGLGETLLIPGWLPHGRVRVWLVDCPKRFGREGHPYLQADGTPWPDNHFRFALLAKVAALIGEAGGLMGWQPQILHANDWQTGLAPAYLSLAGNRQCATIFSIHNHKNPGLFDRSFLSPLGLPKSAFAVDGLEFCDQLGFLKAGLHYSRKLTTMSLTFAREIQQPEFGEGLHGLLSRRGSDLTGILNGVNYTVWDPKNDPLIAHSFDIDNLDGKKANKLALQEEFHLKPDADVPLLGVISSFRAEKGMDLLIEALTGLMSTGTQLVVMGSGDQGVEHSLVMASKAYPGQIGVRLGREDDLAHRIQAGIDMLLMPSRTESCGITQLQAMRYGTLPVVRKTGGLADSVVDCIHEEKGTGFFFENPTGGDLLLAIARGLHLFRDRDRWQQHQRYAMSQDFSWQGAAERYLEVYRKALF